VIRPTQLPLLPLFAQAPAMNDPIPVDRDRARHLTVILGEYTAVRGIAYALHTVLDTIAAAVIVAPDDGTVRAPAAAAVCARFLVPATVQVCATHEQQDQALQEAAERGDDVLLFKDRDCDLRRVVARLKNQGLRVHVRSPHGLPLPASRFGPARVPRSRPAA
jgi:riboflavin biosynthesis pyrimidine reductase